MLKQKDYLIKFPRDLIAGERIVIENDIKGFVNYIQCNGAGNNNFGEYGRLIFLEKNKRETNSRKDYKVSEIMVFEHLPIPVVNSPFYNQD
jgi:hypothetical protein